MVLPALFVLFFYRRNKKRDIDFNLFLVVTVCWFISDLPIIFLIPDGLQVFKSIFVIRYASFLAVAFIYYTFILLAYKNEDLQKQLAFLACHDPLTGLLNRNKFLEDVEKKIAANHGQHYIAMADIDQFKKLNDTYGHLAGDNVLREMASILKKYESPDVKVARYGGEEFIMYLRASDEKEAIQVLEQMQNEIRSTLFKVDEKRTIHVTVSIGFAGIEKGCPLQDAIREADHRLYLAKESNGDRLVAPST
jgi:diguanylate cyclase